MITEPATDEIQNLVRAFSFVGAELRIQIRNAVLQQFPDYATEENLERIGRNRNIPRLPGEDLDKYFLRVLNSYETNRGTGSAEEYIAIIEALGYIFNGFVAGDTSGGIMSFNLITLASGVQEYDGDNIHDGSIKFDAPQDNEIRIEIVQAGAITPEQDIEIRDAVERIRRASSVILAIIQLTP